MWYCGPTQGAQVRKYEACEMQCQFVKLGGYQVVLESGEALDKLLKQGQKNRNGDGRMRSEHLEELLSITRQVARQIALDVVRKPLAN